MSNTNTIALSHFAHKSVTVAYHVQQLMAVKPINPKTFRLSVLTPNDTAVEGSGQFAIEAPVLRNLLNTAYAEIVSATNRISMKDASIPQIERHRFASGWDDTYDGSEEPEQTELTLEEQADAAIDRASVIHTYMKHIAAIKGGGAEWLSGFEVDAWIAVDQKDEEVVKACALDLDLSLFIAQGRVKRVKQIADNFIISLKEYCIKQIAKSASVEWRNKCAYTMAMKINVPDIPVNTAIEYIGDLVSKEAFNRKTSRLEEAIVQAANSRYFSLVYTINAEVLKDVPSKRNLEARYKAAFSTLPYSNKLQEDIEAILRSDEYQDWLLAQDVSKAEEAAKNDLRQAMREQSMFSIEKLAMSIQQTRSQAQNIRDMISKQRVELLAPVSPPPAAKPDDSAKAKRAETAKKAAATRKVNAAAKAKAKETKGVHKASTMPSYNPAGVRH